MIYTVVEIIFNSRFKHSEKVLNQVLLALQQSVFDQLIIMGIHFN